MPKKLDLTGQRFGRLTAVRLSEQKTASGKLIWKCVCDCGQEVLAQTAHLANGRRVSCGCAKIAGNQIRKRLPRHGKTKTRVYRIWSGMKTRCSNPYDPGYYYYGARGITVCPRWQLFDNFYADMGDPPDGLSIDRIDTSKGYEPGNCRWADDITQHRNRTDNVFLEHQGITATIAEWAERTGINKHTIRCRLAAGESHSEALNPRIRSKSEASIYGNQVRWGKRQQG